MDSSTLNSQQAKTGIETDGSLLSSSAQILGHRIATTLSPIMGLTVTLIDRQNRPGVKTIEELHQEYNNSSDAPLLTMPQNRTNRHLIPDAAALCQSVYYYCSKESEVVYLTESNSEENNGWLILPLGARIGKNRIDSCAEYSLDSIQSNIFNRLNNIGLNLFDEKSGFASLIAMQQINGNANKYRMAYVTLGTQQTKDWIANIAQGASFRLPEKMKAEFLAQYRISEKNARKIKQVTEWFPNNIVEFYFMGHSLGGGLASHNAVVTNTPAITFNSASLSPETISSYEQNYRKLMANGGIASIYMEGEVLSLPASSYAGLPKHGIRYKISNVEGGNCIDRHYMRQICSFYKLKINKFPGIFTRI